MWRAHGLWDTHRSAVGKCRQLPMVTRAEVYTLMARHLQSFARIGLVAGGLVAIASPATAQRGRVPDPNATRLMVTTFRAATPTQNLGVQAAEAMRSRMRTDFPFKQVYVLDREELNVVLEASGFPTTEPLQPHDAKALATQVRADEYIYGTATKTATGFRLEPYLVLARDNTLIQPLGVHEGANLTAAATSASKELKEARKQIDAEKACVASAREKKYSEAKAAARAGIAAYPKATLARICLGRVFLDQKTTDTTMAIGDSLLPVAREVVAIDPRSRPGLELLATAYQDLKMSDSMIVTLTRLLQYNPGDGALQTRVIEIIANEANPSVALPIINEAVAANPGDPDLLRMRWRLLYATRNYKEMFAAGEELIKLDTALADTSYFLTTSLAYVRDSQPQKAAETAARGVSKFPTHPGLILFQVTTLRSAGQAQQALEVLDRARAANINFPEAGFLRLALMRELGKSADEILPIAREVIAAGDTSTLVRQIVLQATNDHLKAANESKAIPDFEKALATANYADTVSTAELKPQAFFLLGAIHAAIGQAKIVKAYETKDCALAKEAKNHLADAQINLPKGNSFQPELFKTLMAQVMTQVDPYADQVIGAICK